MKFNDRELYYLSQSGISDMHGRLEYQKPSDWSWMPQPYPFKKRFFRLKFNLLFYYKLTPTDLIESDRPLGVFVLENIQVEEEASMSFAFSLTFKDEPTKKHLFVCRCEDELIRWTSKLQTASCEYWRKQLDIMVAKINIIRQGRGIGQNLVVNVPQLNHSYQSSHRNQNDGFVSYIDKIKIEKSDNKMIKNSDSNIQIDPSEEVNESFIDFGD